MQNQSDNKRTSTIKAVVFDMDGVITDTANLHKQAWKQTFDLFLRTYRAESPPQREFSYQDYYDFVDGKPRMQGIQSFLKSRNIDLPTSSISTNQATDNGQLDSIEQIAEAKNKRFLQLLEEDGAPVYDSTIQLIYKLKRANIPVAVASSSKNCRLVLSYTSLLEQHNNQTAATTVGTREAATTTTGRSKYLDAILDGNDLDKLRLQGKPHPDMFLKAVELIDTNLNARECVVFEDATSGVEAGKNGNFGLVVGVDRVGQEKQLYEHGAHVVVKDLKEIDSVDALNKLYQRASSSSTA